MADTRNRNLSAEIDAAKDVYEIYKKLEKEAELLNQKFLDVFREELKNRKTIEEFLKARLGEQLKYLTAQEEEVEKNNIILRQMFDVERHLESQKNKLEKTVLSLKNGNVQRAETLEYIKKTLSLEDAQVQKLTEETYYREEIIKKLEEIEQKRKDDIVYVKQQYKALVNQTAELEEQVIIQDKVSNVHTSIFGILTKTSGVVQTMGEAFVVALNAGKDFGRVYEKLATKELANLKLYKLGLGVVQKGQELIIKGIYDAMNYEDERRETVRGLGQDYSIVGDNLFKTQKIMRDSGFTNRETLDSYKELFNSATMFSEATQEVQNSLVKESNILKRLGVEASTFSKLTDFLNRGLKQEHTQITQTTDDLVKFANVLGRNANTVLSEFNQNVNELIRQGPNLTEVFKELQTTAKQTGVELNSLLGIAKGFDTFEDAATKVGQLNAYLQGSFLNTIEFINEHDPVKRIQMVVKAFKEAGRDFNSLGYYGSPFIAQLLGTDEDKLSRIMNSNMNDVQSLTEALNGQTKQVNDLDKISSKINVTTREAIELTKQQTLDHDVMRGAVSTSIDTLLKFNKQIAIVGMGLQAISAVSTVLSNTILVKYVLSMKNAELATRGLGLSAMSTTGKLGAMLGALGGIGGLVYSLSNNDGSASSYLSSGASAAMAGASIGSIFGGPLIGGLIGGAIGLGANFIGSFAEGTNNTVGGLAVVGEKGPELVVLPPHSSVINNSNSRNFVNDLSKTSNKSLNQTISSATTVNGKKMNLNVTLMMEKDVLAKHMREIAEDTMEENLNIILK